MSEAAGFDAVCVGAHPDDVEIGMGATVAKMCQEGRSVAIVDLTNGEPTPFGTVEKRAEESRAAADQLGAERITLTQPNRHLFDSVEARYELAGVLRRLRPRMLFIPFATDAHPDHIAASQIALAARFYSKFTKTDLPHEPFYPPRVFRYVAVHQRIIAQPSFIVDVSDHLSVKLEALAMYRSQFAANPANSDLIGRVGDGARMWGALGGVAAGEPFFALEPIALSGPDVVL